MRKFEVWLLDDTDPRPDEVNLWVALDPHFDVVQITEIDE